MKEENNKIILYQDDNGITNVSVRFADEDLWLTQKHLAEIYEVDRSVVTKHILNIYEDGELEQNRTCANFALVQREGNRDVKREIDHSQFLEFAEFQALEQNPMTMRDWVAELDNQILHNKRKLLKNSGKISHAQAIEKAEKEFEVYRAKEMKMLESDFDLAVKQLTQKYN